MKKLIVALGLIAFSAGAAYGQTVLNVPSPRDSSGGTAYVQPNYIINDTCAVGMADSSAILKFSGYSALGLWIKAQGQSPVRLAVQVRIHANPAGSAALPDSENVAVWFPSENSSIVSTGATDSLTYGYFRAGDSVTQHNGEIMVRTLQLGAVATKWSAGNSVYLYLPVRAPYISVRVRHLSSAGVARIKVMAAGLRD